jgi:ubiquinone/menaquinone biosynthesis C-methylase UbiE
VGCHCCGVDRSEAMLAEARRQLSGVQLVRASAEQTGLPNAYFDLVLLVDVVHHLTDRLRTLRECLRILRPSGKLCIATESAELIRRREPHASYFPEAIDIELARYPALEILKSQLASAGFDKVQEQMLEFQTELTDIEPYRTKAHSSLQLISESGFAAGIDRLERDLRAGPIPYTWRYLLLSAAKPGGD